MSSKQLEGILGRATRATPVESPKLVMVTPEAPYEREKLLQARIPASIKRQVMDRAHVEGVTVRTLLLQCLAREGIAVPSDELRDRRK